MEIAHMLSQLSARLAEETTSSLQLRLVAKMTEARLVHSGNTVPEFLIALVDRLCGEELPTLLYSEIVLANRGRTILTFAEGDVGQTEAAFYRHHQLIEAGLDMAIGKVGAAIKALLGGEKERAIVILADIEVHLAPMLSSTSALSKMPTGHFSEFRKFLVGTRGLKGPSGAFSGRVPWLEVLVRGTLPPDYREYLQVNWKYLPAHNRPGIEQALVLHDAGHSLQVLADGTPAADLVQAILNTFHEFRLTHYRAVSYQVPEVIAGQAAGTGGEVNPGKFLRNRIQSLRQ